MKNSWSVLIGMGEIPSLNVDQEKNLIEKLKKADGGSNTASAFWPLLPTGNLIRRSALSFMAEDAGVFLNRFIHPLPECGLLNQGLFTKRLLHNKIPLLNLCGV